MMMEMMLLLLLMMMIMMMMMIIVSSLPLDLISKLGVRAYVVVKVKLSDTGVDNRSRAPGKLIIGATL
jgi:hypothetical protein